MGKKFDPNKSLAVLFPDLAAQAVGWDPKEVFAKSGRKLLWRCDRGHEWDALVSGRTNGKGCPICSGKYVQEGFNDIATTHPEIASQAFGWNPKQIVAGSNRKLRWKCELGHEWDAQVADRTRDASTHCPFCVGKKVWQGFNDLVTTHPEIASQAVGWNPKEVSAGSHRKVRWRCELGHEWDAIVKSRVAGHGCSICSGKYVQVGFNDLSHTHPEIASQAFGWNPKEVSSGSDRKLRWRCEQNHEWDSTVSSRVRGFGCPVCAKTGFDPSKDGWIYFLDHDELDMFQIGITNQPDDRIGKHSRKGWRVLEIRGSMSGELARKWEVSILKALESRGAVFGNLAGVKKFDGFTESWLKSSVTVSGLKELMDFVHEDESLKK
jgi:hypothetical protein